MKNISIDLDVGIRLELARDIRKSLSERLHNELNRYINFVLYRALHVDAHILEKALSRQLSLLE